MIRAVSAVLLMTCWIAGCGGQQIEIPRPTDTLVPPPAPPSVEPSVVNLEVGVPLNELVAVADGAVAQSSGKEDSWQDGGTLPDQRTLQYQYWVVRGPLNVTSSEDRLVSDFPSLQYRLALRMAVSDGMTLEGRCGYGNDPPKRVRLIARSRLSWTDRWTVKSDTTFDPPQFRDACLLTGLNTDATPIVRSIMEARLPSLAAAIDAKVKERSESRARAQKVWAQLQRPRELGQDRWLLLNPQDAQVSPILADGQLIRTSINLILQPQIRSGPAPAAQDRPLPPLRLSPTSFEGFHLVVPVFAEYAAINRRMEQRLVGQRYKPPIGDAVEITSAQLYGSGEHLIVELGVTGGMNGKLYATGKPVYDRQTRILRFEQFNYTTDTRNVVVHSADALFHQDFLARIEPETRIDLSDRMDNLRSRLSSLLTQEVEPGVWLKGTVTTLDALGVYPVPGGVEVQVVADGVMHLSVR
ncbi:MAG TPA: DUF4403 family protein [Nitrospira sp.]|nr:DUF4403 family protein [Nitrospira sp.]